MKKIIEGIVLVLVIVGIGYIFYSTVLLPHNNMSLLEKGAIETKGFVYQVGGQDGGCWLNYMFNVDGKNYHGIFDCDGSAHMGDTINVVYLKGNPEINAKK